VETKLTHELGISVLVIETHWFLKLVLASLSDKYRNLMVDDKHRSRFHKVMFP